MGELPDPSVVHQLVIAVHYISTEVPTLHTLESLAEPELSRSWVPERCTSREQTLIVAPHPSQRVR